MGINEKRIAKTADDNFWIAGESGPCGPDSEIFYFRSNDEIPEIFDPEDERWVEIWNNVFMQYFKDENVYAQIDEWIEDFISQAPPAKRDEIRQLIKENTEII